jgi:GNAT superfamily N-acetyltransferase
MTQPPIDLQFGDCQELETFLSERIYEFNSKATGYFDAESFGAAHRDDARKIFAGISGFLWGGCCVISYLWVADERRGEGWGTAMLKAVEKSAIDKGCKIALLSSHSFQSPNFYKRMGYEQQATIEDYPVGYADVVFTKPLAPVHAVTSG